MRIQWTGRHAALLRESLRMTTDEFAATLGVASRTVAYWTQRGTDVRPRLEIQQALDVLVAQLPEADQVRIAAVAPDPETVEAPVLHIAIAIVLRSEEVLLVRRRDTGEWQFPAGIVKPETSPETIAVRETSAETGIDCAVRGRVGSRVHPKTGVFCVYLQCDYLAGDPENRDTVENDSVRWVPRAIVHRFIDLDRIYPPVRQLLQEEPQ